MEVDDEQYKPCFCGTDRHLLSNSLPFEGAWVQCDGCERWIHGECAGLSLAEAEEVEAFTCRVCETEERRRRCPSAARGGAAEEVWARHSTGTEFWPAEVAGVASDGTVSVRFVGWSSRHDLEIPPHRLADLLLVVNHGGGRGRAPPPILKSGTRARTTPGGGQFDRL